MPLRGNEFKDFLLLAEKEGVEPSEPVRVHLISNQAHSATLSLLRDWVFYCFCYDGLIFSKTACTAEVSFVKSSEPMT